MTIDNFSRDFPIISQYTYANTAASGLMYESLMEWRQGHDIDFLIGGSKFRDSLEEQIADIRTAVAVFFNAEVDNTILTPNFSFALKTLVNGIDKQKSILLLDGDYPSVNWPFVSGDFKSVTFAKVDQHLEENIRAAFKNNQPDIFAFSIVQYIDGIKIDLNFIKDLKKEYPNTIFIADGTQYSGTESFSFKDAGIDVFGGSGYKWLLAGYGNGYMLFSESVVSLLYPKSLAFEPQEESFQKDKNHLKCHFEPGHLDTLNFGSLLFSIEQFNEIGMEGVTKHLKSLSEYAVEKFSALDLLSEEVAQRQVPHSTIFNLNVDDKMIAALKSRNIIFSMRGSGVRVSFHIYNTMKDIDKIVNILKHK
ncbi:aminotransferase class V-fold PLP-dependent enzyme [Joostella atrarenae]|uniref:Aminotransferase class V-fold PLP-dependent enzyme n=1 Tax=Joostella atrarenae TaxID=679257 RepID=A0ABS9J671_9FLAO|nr:aminotransferase class V-fold PLP-dependent enzyme [Joostella atrarenae]MCF8715904.1 aminotransferase class V-fold PLP-dependent enzyme [Joostella atrarenae]